MRILHLCLSNWFVDEVGYQENELVQQHISEGHEVLVVASPEICDSNAKIIYLESGSYRGTEGAQIVRIPYRKFLPRKIMSKLRMHSGLGKILGKFKPETILFHGTCGWELVTVAIYVKKNPDVLFYVDSHEDFHNSARNFISKYFLHKIYYASILQHSLPLIRKILCYSPESLDFCESVYGVPIKDLELFPLGGHPLPDSLYRDRRSSVRRQFDIDDNQVLIVQSGKQTRRKNLLTSLQAVCRSSNENLVFLIAGSIDESIAQHANQFIENDNRIRFLGWQSFDDLTGLLCAADIYLQPGTQSVTMQHSLCCRCAVILSDFKSHRVYIKQNGWLIGRDGNLDEILASLKKADLNKMKQLSFDYAKKFLDYKILARRILQPS